jgi:hypothetical protein
MRTFFFLAVMCLFYVAAFGQTIGSSPVNIQPQMLVIADHPEHASETGMAQSHDLREHSGSTSAQGERPLWEFMKSKPVTPLGDLARDIRKEHATAKKATRIWTN